MFGFLKPRDPLLEPATKLYGSVVAQARQPFLYARLSVPDTMEGRFELIILHLAMIIDRIRSESGSDDPFAKTLTGVFVTDIDDSYREIGISDTKVPAKVKKAAAVLYDRTLQYRSLDEAGDLVGLRNALGENIWRSDPDAQTEMETASGANLAHMGRLAAYVRAARKHLAEQTIEQLETGRVTFPDPEYVAA
ncbi:MAG: ubiquinol-cytochrome C chaperone family protein [Pseudomonadota bacterium]